MPKPTQPKSAPKQRMVPEGIQPPVGYRFLNRGERVNPKTDTYLEAATGRVWPKKDVMWHAYSGSELIVGGCAFDFTKYPWIRPLPPRPTPAKKKRKSVALKQQAKSFAAGLKGSVHDFVEEAFIAGYRAAQRSARAQKGGGK